MHDGRTSRTIDGRLFPAEAIGPFRLSAQGGIGYQSDPRTDLPYLEDYTTVEVAIFSDRPEPIDPATLGLPVDLAAMFPLLGRGVPSIAGHVPQGRLAQLRTALEQASERPHAGIPTGAIGWSSRTIHLACEPDVAAAVADYGLDIANWTDGPLGRAIYVPTSGKESSVDARATIVLAISDSPWIVDLRNTEDADAWRRWKSGSIESLAPADFRREAIRAHIEGVFDPVHGLVIFDTKCLTVTEVIIPDPDSATRARL